MIRKTLMVAAFMGALMVTAASLAADFPDELMDKVMALKADDVAKKEMPASLPGIAVISASEIQKLVKDKKAAILDTRIKSQFDTEKIQGAVWFGCDELIKDPAAADKLEKGKDYVLYCNGPRCWRSPATALMLQNLGFSNLHWYRDGIPDWKKKGLPVL